MENNSSNRKKVNFNAAKGQDFPVYYAATPQKRKIKHQVLRTKAKRA